MEEILKNEKKMGAYQKLSYPSLRCTAFFSQVVYIVQVWLIIRLSNMTRTDNSYMDQQSHSRHQQKHCHHRGLLTSFRSYLKKTLN